MEVRVTLKEKEKVKEERKEQDRTKMGKADGRCSSRGGTLALRSQSLRG